MARRKNIKDKTAQVLFDQLYDAGYRPSGTAKVKKKKRKKNRGGIEEAHWLDESQTTELIEFVKLKSENRKPGSKRALINEMIVLTLLTTGLRVAELCDLCFKDLPAYHKKLSVRVRFGKNDIDRSIDLPEFMVLKFAEYKEICRFGARSGSRVFVSEKGNNLDPENVRSKLEIIGKILGFIKFHPHMLRHTYAIMLYKIHKDLRYVQQQLGHASIITTQIYTRTDSESGRKQVEGLFVGRLYL